MKNLKKLTLLHSNDLHGDFLAERIDNKLVGGVSMLSGYINKVREEEENVYLLHRRGYVPWLRNRCGIQGRIDH